MESKHPKIHSAGIIIVLKQILTETTTTTTTTTTQGACFSIVLEQIIQIYKEQVSAPKIPSSFKAIKYNSLTLCTDLKSNVFPLIFLSIRQSPLRDVKPNASPSQRAQIKVVSCRPKQDHTKALSYHKPRVHSQLVHKIFGHGASEELQNHCRRKHLPLALSHKSTSAIASISGELDRSVDERRCNHKPHGQKGRIPVE